MSLLTWQPMYSVENPEFDAQHKRLIALINQLHDSMSRGHGGDVLRNTLSELITYTQTHFKAEEKWMESHHYPGFADHRVLHDKLTAQVVKFQEEFKAGKGALSVSMMVFLRDWLTHHILEHDKKYAAFAKKG